MDAKSDPQALLEKGQQLLAAGEEQVAIQFFRRALEVSPTDVEVAKILGEALMEVGQVDEAKSVFLKCVELDPSDGGMWMYLGQVENGKQALEYYEKGVTVLTQQMEQLQQTEPEEAADLARQISCAYCSLAELFMSDLCFEPDAESRCEKYLLEAQKVCTDNPQALQGMASFKLSQCKPEEAKPLILRAANVVEELMRQRDEKYDDIMNQQGADEEEVVIEGTDGQEATVKVGAKKDGEGSMMLDEDDGDAAMEDAESAIDIEELEELLPPFEFRAATARILIEVDEHERALGLLEKLIEENDEIAEVWLLLARCHMAQNQADEALECLERSSELCEQLVAFEPSLGQEPQFVTLMQNVKSLKEDTEKRINGASASSSSSSSA